MRSFLYFIREAASGIKNNISTVLGAIVTIYLSLLVIGIFLVATLVIDQLVSMVENQVAISVFLRDDASDEHIWEMQGFIRSLPGVGEVTFLTKEEAIARFEQQFSPEIVESLRDNPLPPSIEVSLLDPSQVENVASLILSHPLFPEICDEPDNPTASIRYGQDYVERLFSLTRVIRYVSLGLVLLLVFVALIFINNTIRLAIFARRQEIAIMRLVGASNGFIRGPFLTEGTLQALVGSGLAVLTIHYALQAFSQSELMNIQWLTANFSLIPLNWIYLALFVSGLALGIFGSSLAMRRYLRV